MYVRMKCKNHVLLVIPLHEDNVSFVLWGPWANWNLDSGGVGGGNYPHLLAKETAAKR